MTVANWFWFLKIYNVVSGCSSKLDCFFNFLNNAENDKLVVKYSHGDNGACAVRKRRSNKPSANVNIYFSCGKSIGRPEILPK